MRRWLPLLGWSLAMLLLGLVPLAIGWSHMPDPAATHWGFGGGPNGHLALIALPFLQVALIAIALLTTSLFRVEGEPTPEAFAMVGLMGGLGTALGISLVYLNWDAASWDQAAAFDWWHFVLVVLVAVIFGWLGFALGRRLCPKPAPAPIAAPMIEVADGERVSWVGHASVRWPLFLLVPALVVYQAIPGWGAILSLVLVLLALGMMQVGAIVNDRGLTVHLGGVTARWIPLEKIVSAHAIDLEPTEWGGWGWRAAPNGSAIVLRRGDALEVDLSGERRFAVTVDDAATGAALLNGLVVRMIRRN